MGWRPEASLSGGTPWVYAGLAVGGFELRDPLAPARLPAPGIAEAQVPLAWYDSATVVVGEGAAERGFGAGLAVASGWMRPPDGGNPRAVFTGISGAHGLDRNGVLITRGDPDNWMRIGAIGGKRGAIGTLNKAGEHLWCVSAGRRRGAQGIDVSFVQRGMGEAQTVGAGESGRGQAGTAGWAWGRNGDSLGVRFARGFDSRAYFLVGADAGAGSPFSSRRSSSERTLDVLAHRQRGDTGYGLHIERSVSVVTQGSSFGDGSYALARWSTQTLWLAATHTRPLRAGILALSLGLGRDPTMARAADRNVVAPAVTWHLDQGSQRVRVFFERVVDPVWSDLDRDFAPFLQHTWTGGFGADAGIGAPASASLNLLAGRTANRATMFRNPIRAEELGVGLRADGHRYNFLALQPAVSARWRRLVLDASGFALANGHSSAQPRVDPALGGQAGAGGGFSLFTGDLGVKLRAQAAYIGARESDTRVLDRNGLSTDATLPGYATFSATATMTFGDATIVIRGDGLEGRRHALTWFDYVHEGIALDGGRQLRAEVVWPLFN